MSEHEIIMEALIKLLQSTPNDGVRLMVMEPDKLLKMATKLDLTGVTELKRGSNGTFEMKLINKLDIIRLIAELCGTREKSESETTRSLIGALYDAAGISGYDEPEN